MELALDVFLRGILTITAVIGLTRLNGLRSFSKMSSFDFSLTVAFGSIIGGIMLSPDSNLWLGVLAVACIFLAQFVVALGRSRLDAVEAAVDNVPLLLMEGETLSPKAMQRARVTEADIRAKLREANVLSRAQVKAVVLESTGDVSVLHADGAEDEVDLDYLLKGVRRMS